MKLSKKRLLQGNIINSSDRYKNYVYYNYCTRCQEWVLGKDIVYCPDCGKRTRNKPRSGKYKIKYMKKPSS